MPEHTPCECNCRYDEHDHRPDDARPRGARRCIGVDSYGCPCQCPGYEPKPDEDSIDPDDAGGVRLAYLDELDDLCRGRSVAAGHRITSYPEEDLDA